MELIREFLQAIDPQTLANGGLLVLVLVIFAETGLMVGFFLPGDSLLFTAGLLCATGQFETSIWLLVGSLILAAIAGDQVGYWFGKKTGQRLFTRPKSWLFKPKYVQQTHAFYERHGGKTIIIGRFVPIVRTFAPILAGVGKLDYRTFVLYNVSGGFIWVSVMTLAGYFLGQLFPQIKDYIHYILVGIILASVVPIITTFVRERRNAKKAGADASLTEQDAERKAKALEQQLNKDELFDEQPNS